MPDPSVPFGWVGLKENNKEKKKGRRRRKEKQAIQKRHARQHVDIDPIDVREGVGSGTGGSATLRHAKVQIPIPHPQDRGNQPACCLSPAACTQVRPSTRTRLRLSLPH